MSEQPNDRHLPLADVETEEYWAHARRHQLAIRFCADCELHYHYPRRRCIRCLGENTSWRVAEGRGTVYSFTEIHQAAARPLRDRTPYILALIDLDEGVRMMADVDAEPGSLSIGHEVEVAWREDNDVTLPMFVPITRSGRRPER